jgi:hypothetical protein
LSATEEKTRGWLLPALTTKRPRHNQVYAPDAHTRLTKLAAAQGRDGG